MIDAVDTVLELMRTTFGDDFKTYYNGDPEVIPRFNLPCIIVTQTTDETSEGDSGEDEVRDQIRIKVLRDRSEDYTGELNPLNTSEKRVRDIIGAKGADGRYIPKTVKGALRNALLDGVEAIAPSMTVEYGINPRESLGDADANADWTTEGWVTFIIRYSVRTY